MNHLLFLTGKQDCKLTFSRRGLRVSENEAIGRLILGGERTDRSGGGDPGDFELEGARS